MSVSLTYAATMTAVETLEGNTPSAPAATRKVTHSAFNKSGTYSATTSPAADKVAYFTLTLTAGAATVNLAALTGTNAVTVDGTGEKVNFLRIENTGANTLTIAEGAANGYAIGGTIVIPPGGHFQMNYNGGLPTIAAADRTLDVTGTGTQTSNWSIVMG